MCFFLHVLVLACNLFGMFLYWHVLLLAWVFLKNSFGMFSILNVLKMWSKQNDPIFELSWCLRSMCVAAPTSSLWSKQALLLYGTQEDDCTLLFFFSSGASQPRSLLTGLRIEAAQPQEAKESMQEASSLQQLSYQGLLPYGFWRGKFKYILYSLWQLLLLLLHLRYFCSK